MNVASVASGSREEKGMFYLIWKGNKVVSLCTVDVNCSISSTMKLVDH